MFCTVCGERNEEGEGMTCRRCGSPLGTNSSGPGSSSSSAYASPGYSAAPQSYREQFQVQGGPYQAQNGVVQAAPPATACPASVPLASMPIANGEGCVAAAWRDIKSTPGWVKKVMLLGLMSIVPILNLVVAGYALRWARDLSFGKREAMPQKIFGEKVFLTGFYAWVFLIVVNIVVFGVAYILNFIPFLGQLIVLVGIVFINMFVNACLVRMAVLDTLGAAFGFSRVGSAYKRALGSLFSSSVLPGLIVGLIAGAMYLVLSVIFALFGFAALNSMYSIYSSVDSFMLIFLAAVGVLIGLFFAICWAIIQVFTYRAVGHWAARTAPEWTQEARISASSSLPYEASGAPYASTYGAYAQAAPVDFSGGAPSPVYPMNVVGGSVQNQPYPSNLPPLQEVSCGGGVGAPRASAIGGSHELSCEPEGQDAGTTRLDTGDSLSGSLPVGPTLVLERDGGERFIITNFPATIGKGSAANCRISHNENISRVHARISFTGTSFVVEDLDSLNHTYINDAILQEGVPAILKDGTELRFADECFRVNLP